MAPESDPIILLQTQNEQQAKTIVDLQEKNAYLEHELAQLKRISLVRSESGLCQQKMVRCTLICKVLIQSVISLKPSR